MSVAKLENHLSPSGKVKFGLKNPCNPRKHFLNNIYPLTSQSYQYANRQHPTTPHQSHHSTNLFVCCCCLALVQEAVLHNPSLHLKRILGGAPLGFIPLTTHNHKYILKYSLFVWVMSIHPLKVDSNPRY